MLLKALLGCRESFCECLFNENHMRDDKNRKAIFNRLIFRVLSFVLILLLVSCADTKKYNADAIRAGDYLIASWQDIHVGENNGHLNMVRVGDGLIGKLRELKPATNSCVSKLAGTKEDSEASHLVKIFCDQIPVLGIRLRYDKSINKFHILGWWTSGLQTMPGNWSH